MASARRVTLLYVQSPSKNIFLCIMFHRAAQIFTVGGIFQRSILGTWETSSKTLFTGRTVLLVRLRPKWQSWWVKAAALIADPLSSWLSGFQSPKKCVNALMGFNLPFGSLARRDSICKRGGALFKYVLIVPFLRLDEVVRGTLEWSAYNSSLSEVAWNSRGRDSRNLLEKTLLCRVEPHCHR